MIVIKTDRRNLYSQSQIMNIAITRKLHYKFQNPPQAKSIIWLVNGFCDKGNKFY